MARPKKSLTPDLTRRAMVLRARRALDEIDELRFVDESVKAGVSQDAVAEALGASQATISRIIRRISEQPRVLAPSVDEIVNRAAVKQISRKQMVDDLRRLKIAYVQPDKKPDSEWAKIRTAYRDGLLSKSEATAIAEAAAERLVGRVTLSMDLEAQAVPEESTRRMLRETTEKLVAALG